MTIIHSVEEHMALIEKYGMQLQSIIYSHDDELEYLEKLKQFVISGDYNSDELLYTEKHILDFYENKRNLFKACIELRKKHINPYLD